VSRIISILLLCLLAGCFSDQDDSPEWNDFSISGKAMGTTWKVTVRTQEPFEPHELIDAVASKIKESEKILSHWRPDAELYQFNQNVSTSPISVDPLMYSLIQHAGQMHEVTDGAFDITIAPLVNLWGFGPVEQTRESLPTKAEIEKAQTLVGMENLEILSDHQVQKKLPTLQLDLSGSAKGAIIDEVCAVLDEEGFQHYLVEIGGELRARGNGVEGEGWRVALEDGSDGKMTLVKLQDSAVATSGTYRLNKPNPDAPKPASHLIDPRTGSPVEHDLVAVNVFAQTARDADAWATAFMILGSNESMKIAHKKGLAVRFCIQKGDLILYRSSFEYNKLMRK